MDRRIGGNRRHFRDDRAVFAVPRCTHEALRRRPRELSLLRLLVRGGSERHWQNERNEHSRASSPGNRRLTGDRSLTLAKGSLVEGIGRPRVEESFLPQLVDEMIKVPDAATFATMRLVNQLLGRKVGGSTGTNCYAALRVMCDMVSRGERGSVVSIICDSGDRYANTYYNEDWIKSQGFELETHMERIEKVARMALWIDP